MSERIDETVPGGYYIGVDGVPHDAHGRPIEATPEPKPDTDESSAAESNLADNAAVIAEPVPAKTKKGKGK